MASLLPLTLANLKKYAVHAIPDAPSTALPGSTADERKQIIVNQAGQHLYNARPWKFRERPPKKLNFAAPITLTNATWTESSKTLTKTGAFASYTFVPGDEVEITDGTGATDGTYPVASKTSSDAIVLVDSIGSAADGQTDIDGEMSFPYVALPSDFGVELNVQATGLTVDFEMVDFGTLATMRDGAILPAGFMYYGAIVQPAQALQTAALGAPRLELYPAPNAASVGALTLWYLAGWRELTDDTHYAAIPGYAEMLLIQYIRAFAEGYDNDNDNEGHGIIKLEDRLELIERGPIFKAAVRHDTMIQSNYGVVGDGLIGAAGSGFNSVVRTQDHWPQASPFVY